MADHADTEATRTATPRAKAWDYDIRGGSKIGRFSVLAQVGEGGMGRIYEAYDANLDRRIALKLLHGSGEDSHRQRLVREAQALARLHHPNVVTVHEVGVHEGVLFVAMEYLPGGTLKQWMGKHPVGSRERCEDAIRLILDAGRGLEAAHAAGLVHRDVKPSNILMDDGGRAKVADFGIARWVESGEALRGRPDARVSDEDAVLATADSRSGLTRTGASVGTPTYMAPEQFGRGAVDAAADQFALCVAAWEALFGVRPFVSTEPGSLLNEMRNGELRRPPEVEVDVEVEAGLRKGLRFRPGSRHRDLSALLRVLEPHSRPVGVRRGTGLVWGVGVGAIAAIGSFAAYRLGRGETLCSGANEKLAAVWNDERRREIRDAVLGTDLDYAPTTWSRVELELDTYGAEWTAAYQEACEATQVRGEQTPARMDERMSCLERGRLGIAALLELMASGESDVLAQADDVVAALPRVGACEMASGFSSADEPMLERIAEARTLRLAGRPKDALIEIEAVIDGLEANGGSAVVEASARLEHGKSLFDAARLMESMEPLRTAYALAHTVGLADEASEAAIALATLADFREDAESLRTWWQLAKAENSRTTGRQGCELLWLEGAGLVLDGDQDGATVVYEQAIDVAGEEPTLRARALRELAFHLGRKKIDPDRGAELSKEALRLHTERFGADHPGAAEYERVLAVNLNGRGEPEAALEIVLRALARRERAYGVGSRATGVLLANAAGIACSTGRGEEGRAWAERALAVLGDETSPARYHALSQLQNCLSIEGAETPRVVELNRTRVAVASELYGEQSYSTIEARSHLALVLLGEGRESDARIQLLVASTLARHARSQSAATDAIANAKLASIASALGEESLAVELAETAASIASSTDSLAIVARVQIAAQLCSVRQAGARKADDGRELAVQACRDALDLARQSGHVVFVAALQGDVGLALKRAGHQREGLEYFEASMHAWREMGDELPPQFSTTLNEAADTLEKLGQHAEAEAHYLEAYELRKQGDSGYTPIRPATGYARMLAHRAAFAEAQAVLAEVDALTPDKDGGLRGLIIEAQGYIHGLRNNRAARDRAYAEAYALLKQDGYERDMKRICDEIDFELEACSSAAL